jgi:putative hydrolase of the HAD superfamily
MNKINLVIIDLDDTIYSEYDFVQSGFRHVAENISVFVNYSVTFLVRKMNDFYIHDRKTVFNQLINSLKIEDHITLEKCIELYKFHSPTIKPYEDFYEFCKVLEKLNISLVLLTDGDVIQQKNKVLSLGIEKFFKKIYFSDSYGIDYRKPNVKIYLEILNDHRLNVNEILAIGDNPTKDFLCIKTLGINALQILRPNAIYANSFPYCDNVRPVRIIKSLTEIKFI